MQKRLDDCDFDQVLDQVLGYLNFSSGATDEHFLNNLNRVFAQVDVQTAPKTVSPKKQSLTKQSPPATSALHTRVSEVLLERLNRIKIANSAFSDSQQAARVIDLVFNKYLSAYLDHHRDLLFHRTADSTFNSFFVGRVCEAVLSSNPMDLEAGQVIKAVHSKLNDFIGHRPLPTLETQKVEPYANEWVRPIPMFIRAAGVAHGPYHDLISETLVMLENTSAEIQENAQFSLTNLNELALDPRAFDFDHPINRRPNYHFGQWDEQVVSQHGFYERFVIHEVTLDSLLVRVNTTGDIPRDQLMTEAATALAGTILMASGISGRGPGSYNSTISLSDLLPTIASYRDAFYEQMLNHVQPEHRRRLQIEAATRHQSFGAVRQHLNNYLTRVRSEQMVRSHLGMIFARMGYDKAAAKQANIVPLAGNRILCEIDCRLARGRIAMQQGEFDAACESIPLMMESLRRGIQCGAIVDPWNILGFDANYSLFPAPENSVRDHRIDELVDLMEQIVSFCSKVWIAAAADDNQAACERISAEFEIVVDWWRRFAAHEVESVDAIDPSEIFNASRNVANAIRLAQQHSNGDDSTSSVSLWAKHAELFQSPRAFGLTVDAMIDQKDYSTSMGLLMYWLSQAERIPLEYGDTSFCNLVSKWLQRQTTQVESLSSPEEIVDLWNRFRKFYDYLEVNAETYWNVPRFDLNRSNGNGKHLAYEEGFDEPDEEDEKNELYEAAYEDVVYIDTTNDGRDGSIDEGGYDDDFSEDLRYESERISDRMNFLEISADLFKISATLIPLQTLQTFPPAICNDLIERQLICVDSWINRATEVCNEIDRLTAQVEGYRLPSTTGDHHSLMDYDRQRHYKESLIDQLISVNVEFQNARQMLSGWKEALHDLAKPADAVQQKTNSPEGESDQVVDADRALTNLFAVILGPDRKKIGPVLDVALEALADRSILYVPLSKGGKSFEIRDVRARQCSVGELLDCLPRLGLFKQSYELAQLILLMERNQKTRSGAVTEFDELFRISYSAMIESLVHSTEQLEQWFVSDQGLVQKDARERSEQALFECMEMLTESMLMIWLSHSQTLRLNVLEKIRDKPSWDRLKEFIETYGKNLLTQTFLNMTNVRAILHQGVDQWLTQVAQQPGAEDLQLICDLDIKIPRKLAVKNLTLILEAIIENFTEFRDYNSTTTQSDRGELLYVLLDFLRLRCKYERVCWHLKPVVWAHETLVRNNQNNVARMWRRSLTERVGREADKFVSEYEKLRAKYSIQMATIFDRLNEKFVHPMQIDRLCSLVERAMLDPQSHDSQRIFDLVEHQANSMAAGPNGSGIDVPAWITLLNEEVEKVSIRLNSGLKEPQPLVSAPPIPLAELREQIESLPRR